jgi:hypothetical protein
MNTDAHVVKNGMITKRISLCKLKSAVIAGRTELVIPNQQRKRLQIVERRK